MRKKVAWNDTTQIKTNGNICKEKCQEKKQWKMRCEYSLSENNKSSTNQQYLQNYEQ